MSTDDREVAKKCIKTIAEAMFDAGTGALNYAQLLQAINKMIAIFQIEANVDIVKTEVTGIASAVPGFAITIEEMSNKLARIREIREGVLSRIRSN